MRQAPPTLRLATVVAVLLAAGAANCQFPLLGESGSGNEDATANLNGEWVFSTTYSCPGLDQNGQPSTTTCYGIRGSLFLGVDGNRITGNWALTNPDSARATRTLSGWKDGYRIDFLVGTCDFQAKVYTQYSQTHLEGTFKCGYSGNWSAWRMVPPIRYSGSLTARTLVVGGTYWPTVTVVDAARHQVGRALTVSSDAPSVAAVSPLGVVTAVGPGKATITVATADTSWTIAITSVGPVRFASLSPAGGRTCGVTTDGLALCWGIGRSLGDGTTESSSSPIGVAGGLAWSELVAGEYRACGLSTAGAPYCWDDDGTPAAVPASIALHAITVGDDYACALAADSTAWCWGDSPSPTPSRVPGGLKFTAVANGSFHTCALTADSTAWCWGLFLPDTVPTQIGGGLHFASLSGGYEFSCGLTAAGAAYCWGHGGEGQLGNGKTAESHSPAPVSGNLTFSALASGTFSSCAVTGDGQVYCWGMAVVYDTSRVTTTPLALKGGPPFASVSVGESHACGLAKDGIAYCWGSNRYGELGRGDTTPSTVPVRVVGQR